ncbi:hypothetical protein MNV49_007184 [Pseudohyphozyma bogoriensis]|nr:hypothetical protein MNV49_007184 [Pseudohyphozyma bogoriensis]
MGLGGERRRPATDLDIASTLTSLSLTSSTLDFPSLTRTEYTTLDQVIALLPPSADKWEALATAYKQAGVDEDRYYQVFLKLSLVNGLSWTDKWSNVKRVLGERGVGFDVGGGESSGAGQHRKGFDILKSKVDNIPASSSRRRSNSAAPPATRAREDPSSSTHRLQAPTRPKSSMAARAQSEPEEDEARVAAGGRRAAGPRRDFLFQGYSSSDDYVGVPSTSNYTRLLDRRSRSQANLTTQTPQAAQQQHSFSRRLSTTATHRRTQSSTPAPTHQTTISTYPTDSPLTSTHLATTLETRAFAFRRFSLLSLAWYHWRRSLSTLKTRETNLDAARNVVMLKWGLDRWKGKMEDIWQKATRESRATRFRREMLVAPAFNTWRKKSNDFLLLGEQAEELKLEREDEVKREMLRFWRMKAEHEFILKHHRREKEEAIVRAFWDFWVNKTRESTRIKEMEDLALEFNDNRRKVVALRRWRTKLHRIQSITTTAIAFDSSHLLNRSLKQWIAEFSCTLLIQSRTVRSVRSCLRKWVTRYHHIAIELEGRAIAMSLRDDNQIKASCFDQWVDAVERRRALIQQAEEVNEVRLLKVGWEKWRSRAEDVEMDEKKADLALEWFLQRRTWNVWVEKIAKRKVERWKAEQVMKRKKQVFHLWLAATRQAKAHQALVDEFKAAVDFRIIGEALAKWTHRVVDVRSRELEVQEQFDKKVSRRAFDIWTQAILKHSSDYSMVESFKLVKQEELAAKTFRHWLQVTRKAVELRRRLDRLLEQKRRTTLVDVFDKWRAGSLRSVEKDLVASLGRRRLESRMGQWMDKSKLLLAVRFDNDRIKRKTLLSWRAEIPDLTMRANAIRMDRDNVLGALSGLCDTNLR